jgi:hypothetical protein
MHNLTINDCIIIVRQFYPWVIKAMANHQETQGFLNNPAAARVPVGGTTFTAGYCV